MKIKENVILYTCDHCGKRLLRKKAMEVHEKWCPSNPDNFKACSTCIHLANIAVSYERYYTEGDEPKKTASKAFFCKKLEKKLYPTKVEKMGLPEKHPHTFADQEPMPKECEHFNYGLNF